MQTRHGQSQDNLEDKIGGDSKLTPQGEKYAQALSAWISQRVYGRDSCCTGEKAEKNQDQSASERTNEKEKKEDTRGNNYY